MMANDNELLCLLIDIGSTCGVILFLRCKVEQFSNESFNFDDHSSLYENTRRVLLLIQITR